VSAHIVLSVGHGIREVTPDLRREGDRQDQCEHARQSQAEGSPRWRLQQQPSPHSRLDQQEQDLRQGPTKAGKDYAGLVKTEHAQRVVGIEQTLCLV